MGYGLGSAFAEEIVAGGSATGGLHGLGNSTGFEESVEDKAVVEQDVLKITINDQNGITNKRDYSGIIVYGSKTEKDKAHITVNVGELEITGATASAINTMEDGKITVNAKDKVYIESYGHGINSGAQKDSRITINASDAEVTIIAGENAVDARANTSEDASAKSGIEITGRTITIASKNTGEKTDIKGHAVVARGEGAEVNIIASDYLAVTAVAGKNAVFVKGDNTQVTLKGNLSNTINGMVNISKDIENAQATFLGQDIAFNANKGDADAIVVAGNTNMLTVGDAYTNTITVNGGSDSGMFVNYGAHVNLIAKDTITVNGDKYGLWVQGQNQCAVVNLEAKTIGVTGIFTTGGAVVNLVGNSNITATEGRDAIAIRGGAVNNINVNEDGESLGNTVKIDGNINFTTGDKSGKDAIDASVNIALDGEGSYLKGNIIKTVEYQDEEGNKVVLEEDKQKVTGMKLNLSNGAQWELSEASVVNQATFGKDTVLVLKDGSVFETKTGENVVNVYALNAGDGNANKLTVEQGAKLQIGGIKETTYNIATGFANYNDVKGWTEIADNNLMQAEMEVNGTNLQAIVTAKAADEIASDMGVAGGTADALAGIITAVNGTTSTPTEAQKNVQAFANEIANAPAEQAADAAKAVVKMAEAGGNSATAASIVKNITGVTNDRLSFNCGHSAPHKGGHGVGLLEEGSGADIWVEYVHGKDEVEDMKSTAGATSYEGSYDGIVMGLDFKKVNKFQSGIAFNYGEGDTNSVGTSARTHSDYDFWGIGYYGNIHNDDSNVIFDINYAKTDSDVTNNSIGGLTYEASPETTTWTAGVKVEKLYQNENVQIVPYTGLRYMSIDSDDYATKGGAFNYKMERQDIWLLPLGVSIKQEVTNDNGWTVSPRVDLSYIWAFGDTDSDMEFATAYNNKVTNIGYDVMDDGSFLGLVGIEAHKDQWGFGVSYSYQKGDHSESKKWYVDVNYSF